ncbi:MAG: hypothetical protein RL033_6141 [Pseudomonadota bacterium]|jgi:hypothetical protein
MRGKRRPVQRPLPLVDEGPATLTPKINDELVRALAELLLAAARSERLSRSESATTMGGADEHEVEQ